MIISTYFFKWKHKQASYGEHLDHLEKKVSEDEHKQRVNVDKRWINQEWNKTMHTHTHNM
jgi:hypothetical protein